LTLAVDNLRIEVSLMDSLVFSESSAMLLVLGLSIDFFDDFV
jgi:hypothetical protein